MAFEKQTHLEGNYDNVKGSQNIAYGKVVDIDDPLDSYRIKVRIKGVDDKISDEGLAWCESFLPKFINIIPKKGELAKILFFDTTSPMMRRQWIAPIISQVQNLNFESHLTALAGTDLSNQSAGISISKIPESDGAYANKTDVAIQGRDNSDIIFREKEVLIRAGKFVFNDNTKLNNTNPTYIQLKLKKNGSSSYANIVANKIFLITHNGATTYNPILTEKDLLEIEKNADPAVLGNRLIDFLQLVKEYCLTHIHMDVPPNIGTGKVTEIANFDLTTLISKNIKLN